MSEVLDGVGAKAPLCAEKVAMRRRAVLVLLCSLCMARQWIIAQAVPDSSTNSGSNTGSNSAGAPDHLGDDDSLDWLFPVSKLNRSLPSWIRIGGEFRGRLEGPTGIRFTSTDNFYYLYRLRVKLGIKPKEWLLFYGEVQDSRIFFNHTLAMPIPTRISGPSGRLILRSAVPRQAGWPPEPCALPNRRGRRTHKKVEGQAAI